MAAVGLLTAWQKDVPVETAAGSSKLTVSSAEMYATALHADAVIVIANPNLADLNLSGIGCSFNPAPGTLSQLTIEDVGNIVFNIDINTDAPIVIPYITPTVLAWRAVSLLDGGVGVTGKVNLLGLSPRGLTTQALAKAAATTLNGAITAAALSITVASAAGFPASGILRIENEWILYDSVAGAVVTVNAAGRGYLGSTAATHANGKAVSAYTQL